MNLTVPGKERTCAIHIEQGILRRVKEYLPSCRRWAIISDETVAALYGTALSEQLPGSVLLSVPAGEGSKTLAVYESLCRRLANEGFDRADGIIALGGGMTGDLAGFVAATYLRGVTLVQIPTTLLAQVDSSIGGKTALDLPEGKNLIGAYYQPRAVLIDPDCLLTLPRRQLSSGAAEVIKYAFIADPALLELLTAPDRAAVIRRCIDIKAHIVSADEQDEGLRHILNFGHTFGHAYEAAGGFARYTHGEAVAAGMAAMLRWQRAHGYAAPLEILLPLLERYGLPTRIDCDPEVLAEHLRRDKKAAGDTLRAVLVEQAGRARVASVPISELLEVE